MRIVSCLFLILLQLPLGAFQPAICNEEQHRHNVQIISHVIEKQLDSHHNLYQHIGDIGKEAVANGFSLDAYCIRKDSPYVAITLWEGRGKCPITFLLFIWPSNSTSAGAATDIHAHPIPCALTVLKGELIQYVYEQNQIERQVMPVGATQLDLLQKPFIHRLVCEGDSTAFSLHAYGGCSRDEVRRRMIAPRR